MGIFDATPGTGMFGNPLAGQGLLTGGSNPWLALIGNAIRGGLAGAGAARGTKGFGAGIGVGALGGMQAGYEAEANKRRNALADQSIQSGRISNAATLDQLNRRRAFLGQVPLTQEDFASGNWGGMPSQGGPAAPATGMPSAGGSPAASGGPAWKAYLDMSNRALQYGLTDEAAAYRAAAEADPDYKAAAAMGLIPAKLAEQKALLPGDIKKETDVFNATLPGRLQVANAGRDAVSVGGAQIYMPKPLSAGAEKLAESGAVAYDQAKSTLPLFGVAKQAAKNFPQSGPAGDWALLWQRGKSMMGLPNNASAGEVLQGMQTRLAPLLRLPGSGSTSDMEMRLYVQAVPGLVNTQKGNVALAEIGEKLAQRRIKNYEGWAKHYMETGNPFDYKSDDAPLLSQEETAALIGAANGGDAPPASPAAGGGQQFDYDPASGSFTPR